MKIKVSLFIVALLIVFGMQMVSADTGYPIDGEYGYPIEYPENTEDEFTCDELWWMGHWPERCELKEQLSPPAQPVVDNTPAKEVVPNTPARQMLVAPANQIRRPLVIPVRNVLNNLWRLGTVK